jgi:putative membrane protein
MEENSMSSVIEDIKDNPEIYCGKKIIFPGQVSFHGNDNRTSFSIMRLLMICCAADLQPVGFFCSYPHAANLREKSWKRVFGILRVRNSGTGKEPFIDVIRVIPIPKPEQEYIYPHSLN